VVRVTWQALEEAGRPEGAEAVAQPGGGGAAGGPDVPSLLAFLEEGGQFAADAVARDLDATQVGR
jgi:hypothetical protein